MRDLMAMSYQKEIINKETEVFKESKRNSRIENYKT